ncbi:hypothetical protein [Pseudofulvibacter geojedonensis]|uniref:Polysaccharide chain length determinant N-terminal domain-containing protein n=1 Tax=Pseudofulvibacter geojedonensis TaxID=1123758 RepID=A0ABW3I425_9FLAO
MGDNSNLPRKNSEEIDLIQLFGFFEQKIKGFFKGIFSIFNWVFSSIIYGLKSLQKNINILGPSLILLLVLGVFLDKKEDPKYSSEMLVQPYFEAKYQLYANIEYYNSLLAEKDYETLSSIFGINIDQAKKIKEFEMFPGPETENQLRKEYYDFVEDITLKNTHSIDGNGIEENSKVVLDISFEEFVEGRSIYSSNKYMIKAVSSKKDIFKYLEKGLNNSFDNQYSTKNMKKRDSIISLRKTTIEKTIAEIDSLQKVYVEAFKENVKATSSQIKVGEEGFALADSKVETREFELLEKKNKLYEELRTLQESKVVEDTFFDVISSFPEIGKLEAVPFYKRKMIILPILGFILFVLGLFSIKAYRFIEKYE